MQTFHVAQVTAGVQSFNDFASMVTEMQAEAHCMLERTYLDAHAARKKRMGSCAFQPTPAPPKPFGQPFVPSEFGARKISPELLRTLFDKFRGDRALFEKQAMASITAKVFSCDHTFYVAGRINTKSGRPFGALWVACSAMTGEIMAINAVQDVSNDEIRAPLEGLGRRAAAFGGEVRPAVP